MRSGDVPDISAWGLPASMAVRRWDRGNNNTLWRVGDAYVLRRYDTFVPERVAAEHRLLAALSAELPFSAPAPVPTSTGDLLVGSFALFPLMAGEMATRVQLGLVADALGVLDLALARLPAALAPYEWRPETIHPAVPDLAGLTDQLERALPNDPGVAWFRSINPYVDESSLPIQIVHGDWDLSNVLIDDGKVVAALDFENAGLAARIRDVAASFYSCVDYRDPGQVGAFCRAYLNRVQLTDDERDAFPEQLRLRAFARCVWRSGRWRRGLNSLDSVRAALVDGRALDRWLAGAGNPLRWSNANSFGS